MQAMRSIEPAHVPVLVEAIGEPAFVVDLDGIVVAWNAAAETFFGRQRGAAIGRRCPALVRGRRASGEFVCTLDCPYIQGFGFLSEERATELIVRTAEPGVKRRVTRLHIPLANSVGTPIGLLHIFIPTADDAGYRKGELIPLTVISSVPAPVVGRPPTAEGAAILAGD